MEKKTDSVSLKEFIEEKGITLEVRGTAIKELVESLSIQIPNRVFLSLREVCDLKGLNYKTALNRPYLQPKRYGKVGGKIVFLRDDVIEWLFKTDEEIKQERSLENNGI